MNQKTLTAKDLALYLGCEMEVQYSDGDTFIAKLVSIDLMHDLVKVSPGGDGWVGKALAEVKPILRRLESIDWTDMKALGFSEWTNVKAYIDIEWLGEGPSWTAENFQYLLSKGFDLWGWIDAGLAIDRATLNETKS